MLIDILEGDSNDIAGLMIHMTYFLWIDSNVDWQFDILHV